MEQLKHLLHGGFTGNFTLELLNKPTHCVNAISPSSCALHKPHFSAITSPRHNGCKLTFSDSMSRVSDCSMIRSHLSQLHVSTKLHGAPQPELRPAERLSLSPGQLHVTSGHRFDLYLHFFFYSDGVLEPDNNRGYRLVFQTLPSRRRVLFSLCSKNRTSVKPDETTSSASCGRFTK